MLRPRDGDPIVVLTLGRGRTDLPGVRVHRTTILTDRDVRRRKGLPVASPPRTLLDLAGVLHKRGLELAIDRVLAGEALRRSDLTELLARSRADPGHHRLAAAFHHDRRQDRDPFAHGIVALRYPRRDLIRRPPAVGAEVAGGTRARGGLSRP